MGQVTRREKKGAERRAGWNVAKDGIVRKSYMGDDWTGDKPLLYISGPMASEGNPYTNINHAVTAAVYARMMGWAVIVPHLDCLYAMMTGIGDAAYYIENDLNQLDRCDAVLVLPYKVEYKDGQQSGTSTELDFAEDRDIPIYTVDTLPTGADFDNSRLED